MITRRLLAALPLVGALVMAGAPALAYVHHDAHHDAVGPRSLRAHADITDYRVAYRDRQVVVRITMARTIVKKGTGFETQIRTPGHPRRFEIRTIGLRGGEQSFLFRDNHLVCAPPALARTKGTVIRSRIAHDTTLVVTVPAACVGTPRSIRVGSFADRYDDRAARSQDAVDLAQVKGLSHQRYRHIDRSMKLPLSGPIHRS